jgi:hypothetical protein
MEMTTTDWIQAISTVVLVLVTIFYAWRTHILSKATQKQAEASLKIAESTARPSILLRLNLKNDEWDRHKKRLLPEFIGISMINAGSGPAINIEVMLWSKKYHYPYSTKGYLAQNEQCNIDIDAEMELENTEFSSLQKELLKKGVEYAIIVNYEDINKSSMSSYLIFEIVENKFIIDGEQNIIGTKND